MSLFAILYLYLLVVLTILAIWCINRKSNAVKDEEKYLKTLDPKLPFGAFRGEKFSSVPFTYKMYLLKNLKFHEKHKDLYAAVQFWHLERVKRQVSNPHSCADCEESNCDGCYYS